MTRRRARLAAAVACLLGALALAGCKTSATVAIRMNADGRGTVSVAITLDRAARLALAGAALKPGAITPDVPLDDLRAAGWTITPWKPITNGGSTLQMSKPFAGPDGLAAVLHDLDGTSGALRDVAVTRSRSLLRDRDSVSMVADLRDLRVGVADDPALATRLRNAGVNVGALDAGLQSRLGRSFTLSVAVTLPDGTHAAVAVAPGQEHTVVAASTATHSGRIMALVVAAMAAFLGLACLVIAAFAARARRPRHFV